MNQIEFLNKNVYFTTRQYAVATGVSISSASRSLGRLKGEGSLQSVTRAVWCQKHHPHYSPYGAVPYLLGNEQGYVSFLSSLHRHGVISQIPNVIQIATTGHGRTLVSKIGTFEFFHMQPKMMNFGIETHEGKLIYNIATAEKALLDVFYLSSRKGRRFLKLPELDLAFVNRMKLLSIAKKMAPSIRKLVQPKIELLHF